MRISNLRVHRSVGAHFRTFGHFILLLRAGFLIGLCLGLHAESIRPGKLTFGGEEFELIYNESIGGGVETVKLRGEKGSEGEGFFVTKVSTEETNVTAMPRVPSSCKAVQDGEEVMVLSKR